MAMNADELVRLQWLLCRFKEELQKGKDTFNSIQDDEVAATASYFDGFVEPMRAQAIADTCASISEISR